MSGEGGSPPVPPAEHALLAALPAPASGPPPPAVVARFTSYWQATLDGASLPQQLRAKKAFDNPYALEEVITTFGIDDKSSAYPPGKWDPLSARAADFADVIRARQALEEEARREARRAEGPRAAIAFKVGGALPAEGGGGGGGGEASKRSRFG